MTKLVSWELTRSWITSAVDEFWPDVLEALLLVESMSSSLVPCSFKMALFALRVALFVSRDKLNLVFDPGKFFSFSSGITRVLDDRTSFPFFFLKISYYLSKWYHVSVNQTYNMVWEKVLPLADSNNSAIHGIFLILTKTSNCTET